MIGFFAAISAVLFWTFSCVVGALFGKYISNPEMLGLDFAITAMFIFLGIAQFESVKKSKINIYLVLILFVIVMMLALSFVMPSYVAIIISAVVASALGVVMDR